MSSSTGGDGPGAEVSERWAAWRRDVDLGEYEARWARLAAAGEVVHGEADLIASLGPGPVLDAGCGTGRVAIELARRGIDVVGVDLDGDMIALARAKAPQLPWLVADLATMQLDRRFPVIAVAGNVLPFARPADHRRIVHTLAGHLEPGGRLVAGFMLEPDGVDLGTYDDLCRACGLELEDRWSTWDRRPFVEGGSYHVSVHRRTDRLTVHDLLAAARAEVPRLTPAELRDRMARDPDVVVLDVRTPTDRERFGVVPGSIHAPRTVLEWTVDPASGFSHPASPASTSSSSWSATRATARRSRRRASAGSAFTAPPTWWAACPRGARPACPSCRRTTSASPGGDALHDRARRGRQPYGVQWTG